MTKKLPQTNAEELAKLRLSDLEVGDLVQFCKNLELGLNSGDCCSDLRGPAFYYFLRTALGCYRDSASVLPSHWPRDLREEIGLHMEHYVRLYKLLILTWEDIKKFAEQIHHPIPESPSEAIKAILEADAKLKFVKHVEGKQHSLATHHALGKKVKKAKKNQLTKPQMEELIRRILARLPKDFPDFIDIKRVEIFCLHCIEKKLIPIQDEVKRSLEYFHVAESDMHHYQMKRSHPR